MATDDISSVKLDHESAAENEAKLMNQQEMRLRRFWDEQIVGIGQIDPEKEDFKNLELPLARIKKIMRLEEEIQGEIGGFRFMISAEAPVLLAKAAALFIGELTIRASTHTEDGKRRTLQRQDIAMAMTKSDMYDFLIDIVPREEARSTRKGDGLDFDPQQMLAMQQQALQALMGSGGMMPNMMPGAGMMMPGMMNMDPSQIMQQSQMMMNLISQLQNPQMMQIMMQQQATLQQQLMMSMGDTSATEQGADMGGEDGEEDEEDDEDEDDGEEDDENMQEKHQNDPASQQKMMQSMLQMFAGGNPMDPTKLPEQMQQAMQANMAMMQARMGAHEMTQNEGLDNNDESHSLNM